MRFGTCNACSLYASGLLEIVSIKLKNTNIVRAQEVRCDKDGTEPTQIIHYSVEIENATVSFVHNGNVLPDKSV
jgi:hypothetical protein